ncbi:unnamed protein product [Allacma fusca]|uniref:Uncharacterized protein n=1 Tax=Allacma fusca TaxID=39272 RepID=A0A8J2LJE1_9HEXA|nr:unnamed protein product [Allacma fusca]
MPDQTLLGNEEHPGDDHVEIVIGNVNRFPKVPARRPNGSFCNQTFRSKVTLFILAMILLVAIVAAGIVNNIRLRNLDTTQTRSTVKPTTSYCPDNETNIESTNMGLLVESAADLKELTAEHETIIIESMNEDYTESFTVNENMNVKTLIIHGPISSKWLRFLFKNFPGITALHIDSDGLCSVDMKDMDGFSFEGVTHFGLDNLFRCDDIEWISRCDFPKVRTFSITNTDLTEHNFNCIHAFVIKNRRSLNQIVIKQCFICKTCSFKGISPGNKLSVRISGSKRIPLKY